MSRSKGEVSDLIYASDGFASRPLAVPLAPQEGEGDNREDATGRTRTIVCLRCGHSAIVGIVRVVGTGWVTIDRYGCLSVRLMDLSRHVHG